MIILYNDDIFPQGKYAGKTIEEVAQIDIEYIRKFNSFTKQSTRPNSNIAIADITLHELRKITVK